MKVHRRGSGASLKAGENLTPVAPISVRVPEAIRMTGLGRTTIYELIASGDIEAAKVGRSTVILVDSIRNFLAANPKLPRSHGAKDYAISRDTIE